MTSIYSLKGALPNNQFPSPKLVLHFYDLPKTQASTKIQPYNKSIKPTLSPPDRVPGTNQATR
jgi:hypothetical protein